MKKTLILAAMLFLTTPCFAQENQTQKSDAQKTPAIPSQPSEAHAQNGVCRVTVFSVDHSIPHSASLSESTFVGEFALKFEGSMIVARFEHKESGVGIFVNVTRLKSTLFSKTPMAIRFAIQLFRTPEDGYSFYGGAAESIYDKHWRGSSVSSHLKVGDYKGYTFTVACEKRKK